MNKDIHLVHFLTEGASLAEWHRRGLLKREAELYQRLLPQVGSIAWVSYGGKADLAYQNALPGIEILVNRWRLPHAVYIEQLPWLHRAAFERATLLKSEQTGASRAAVRVARHFGKRLIARSGFSLALFAQYEPEQYAESYDEILALEKISFQAAQQIVVTTEEMRQTAIQAHALPTDKIRVIPNYVNTERFCPPVARPHNEKPYLVFVGRLAAQKNIENLVTALAPLNHTQVDIIGGGELRQKLQARIKADGLEHIRLVGNVPNDELPFFFQKADVYIQPSRYEGHPKTIFEAMACGAAVLAGDAPGVRQFIQHGQTGWLCALDAESIRAALQTLLEDAALREKLGTAARRYVAEHFALEVIVGQELAMLRQTLQSPAPPAEPQARPVLQSARTYLARLTRLLKRRG